MQQPLKFGEKFPVELEPVRKRLLTVLRRHPAPVGFEQMIERHFGVNRQFRFRRPATRLFQPPVKRSGQLGGALLQAGNVAPGFPAAATAPDRTGKRFRSAENFFLQFQPFRHERIGVVQFADGDGILAFRIVAKQHGILPAGKIYGINSIYYNSIYIKCPACIHKMYTTKNKNLYPPSANRFAISILLQD